MGIGEGEVPTRRSGPQTARAGIYDLLECEPARFCATREVGGGLKKKLTAFGCTGWRDWRAPGRR